MFQLRVNDLGNLNCNLYIPDPMNSRSMPLYFSCFGYTSNVKAVQAALKRKGTSINFGTYGGYSTTAKGKSYDMYVHKAANSDYVHLIAALKDTKEQINGQEFMTFNIFSSAAIPSTTAKYDEAKEFFDSFYDKLYIRTPVPMLREWMPYVFSEMRKDNIAFVCRASVSEESMKKVTLSAVKIHVSVNNIYAIIERGLQSGAIKIQDQATASSVINEVTGLDSYLNTYADKLADKIRTSFRPLYVSGEDELSERTGTFCDWSDYRAGIRPYEGQKAVIESVSRCLRDKDSAFIIGEQGSGKTLMGIGSVYAAAKPGKPMLNIIMCPTHLLEKWKREIERLMPNATAEIIGSFHELTAIEPVINSPLRRKHLFLVISKETAKFGYEKRPAAIWSARRKCYLCPDCYQPLYREKRNGRTRHAGTTIEFYKSEDFRDQTADNMACMNRVKVWDHAKREHAYRDCGANLWTPMTKDANGAADVSGWIKSGEGWVERRHIDSVIDRLTIQSQREKIDTKFLNALVTLRAKIQNDQEGPQVAPRKYPIARYIKERYAGMVDFFLADEIHELKGDTEQGKAFGQIASASNKVIGLTGTLVNGYANGIYYLLYRAFPGQMKAAGYDWNDVMDFQREFGVVENTTRYTVSNSSRRGVSSKSNEKALPGISPIVFTKFLLENAVFIGLDDIADGLPSYREVPVPVTMDTDLARAYADFTQQLRSAVGGRKGHKLIGQLYQKLSVYADQPHDQLPVHHPDTGDIVATPINLPVQTRNKEQALVELVRERINAGDKVMVYFQWTNSTDSMDRIQALLSAEGYSVASLRSNTINSRRREGWITNRVDAGAQVLLTNPELVKTGLDLLPFTSIIFYQMGDNLYTMRQASRRSWRLSQTDPVSVYFMYYRGTVQEQATNLAATKLQAAMSIEGKFSEEGLQAMSNNEDFLTQIASSVVNGALQSVDERVFERMSIQSTRQVAARPRRQCGELNTYTLFKHGKKKANQSLLNHFPAVLQFAS